MPRPLRGRGGLSSSRSRRRGQRHLGPDLRVTLAVGQGADVDVVGRCRSRRCDWRSARADAGPRAAARPHDLAQIPRLRLAQELGHGGVARGLARLLRAERARQRDAASRVPRARRTHTCPPGAERGWRGERMTVLVRDLQRQLGALASHPQAQAQPAIEQRQRRVVEQPGFVGHAAGPQGELALECCRPARTTGPAFRPGRRPAFVLCQRRCRRKPRPTRKTTRGFVAPCWLAAF